MAPQKTSSNSTKPKQPSSKQLGLKQLGKKTPLPESPQKATLECIKKPHKTVRYAVRFTAPEFTTLCPVTGQPDFAHLVIDYVPRALLVESKSLKLYLNSFRNVGTFHEDTTITIATTLEKVLTPYWLRIGGYWYPRGGIPIDIFWQTAKPPPNVWIPKQGVPPYKGRG